MFRKRSWIAGLLLAMPAASAGAAQPGWSTMAQSSVPAGPGGQALAVARMTRGILSYARWPAQPAPIRLCLAGASRFTAALAEPGGGLSVRPVVAANVPAEACDAVYLGAMPAAVRAALLARMRGRPVVTIDEADPACRAGAMFCFQIGTARIGMDMNLDAVSRSGVRIDPRVLRLTRQGSGGQ